MRHFTRLMVIISVPILFWLIGFAVPSLFSSANFKWIFAVTSLPWLFVWLIIKDLNLLTTLDGLKGREREIVCERKRAIYIRIAYMGGMTLLLAFLLITVNVQSIDTEISFISIASGILVGAILSYLSASWFWYIDLQRFIDGIRIRHAKKLEKLEQLKHMSDGHSVQNH